MFCTLMNYVVLGAAFIFESILWWTGLKAFRATQGRQGYLDAFRSSKDPTTLRARSAGQGAPLAWAIENSIAHLVIAFGGADVSASEVGLRNALT
jgi:hypothetical protein